MKLSGAAGILTALMIMGSAANGQEQERGGDDEAFLFEPSLNSNFMDVEDALIEEACLFEIEARIRPKVLSGDIKGYSADRNVRGRRTCTVMSLCDTVNGRADYFQVLATTSMGRSPYPALCQGVAEFGAELIRTEPDIFGPAVEARDLFRTTYQEAGRDRARELADTAIENPDASLDLGDAVSPFTMQ